jgi:hypothetical protein
MPRPDDTHEIRMRGELTERYLCSRGFDVRPSRPASNPEHGAVSVSVALLHDQ